jgi:flagellar biosynthesis protein FlgN
MTISSLFAQDIKQLNELVFLLTREQVSLVNADIDTMESMLEEKGALLQKISASAQARYHALAKSGFEPNENGMVAWVSSGADAKAAQNWNQFQASLTQAKELNRINGQLIAKHFNRNQQLLNQLQGRSDSATVYGRNGQASSFGYSNAALSV